MAQQIIMTTISKVGKARPLTVSFSEMATCCGRTYRMARANRKNSTPTVRSTGIRSSFLLRRSPQRSMRA